MKRLALVVLIFFGVLALPASAEHDIGVIWNGHPPITVSVDATGVTDPGVLSAVSFASTNWSASSVINMVSGTKGQKKIVIRMSETCSVACTSYRQRNGHFSEVTVFLSPSWILAQSVEEQQGALCHELGHGIGLGHNPDTTSCLYATTAGSSVPNSHDFEELELIYG